MIYTESVHWTHFKALYNFRKYAITFLFLFSGKFKTKKVSRNIYFLKSVTIHRNYDKKYLNNRLVEIENLKKLGN